MAKDNEKRINGIQIGIPSLVIIFAVLCLVIFAVLSLLSALSDNRLQEKSQGSVNGYYEADALAEEHLAEIDSILLQCRQQVTDEGSYGQLIKNQLGELYNLETGTVEFAETINENLILHVELQTFFEAGNKSDGENAAKRYEITKWQEENISDYEIDDSLPVWTGEY